MPKKVILISGGSDGLGKTIAEKLAPENRVVILSHNIDKLREVAREIGCDFVEGELTDYFSLQSAVNQIIEKHHSLDVLINNAGIWAEGELEDIDQKKVKEIIDVNTTGTILLTKAVLPGMRFRKMGQIINIISQDGLTAKKSRSVYHASKWAITGFTKCIQEDVAEENIKVTAIYPGLMNTQMFKKNNVERDMSDALDPVEVANLVEFVINLSPSTHIPEVGIKNKKQENQNMDDTSAPVIDLNIDPNMIAAQDDSPQAAPSVSAPTAPPAVNPNIINITPGSPDPTPVAPVSAPVDFAPLKEPKTLDITPPVETAPSINHLAPSSPIPETAPSPAPLTPEPLPDGNISPTPAETKPESLQVTQSSPLAEDPDLVKLIK